MINYAFQAIWHLHSRRKAFCLEICKLENLLHPDKNATLPVTHRSRLLRKRKNRINLIRCPVFIEMPLKRKYTLVCALPVFFKIHLSQRFGFCGKLDIIYNIPNLAEGSLPAWISSRHKSTEVLWIDMLPDMTAVLHTSRSFIPIPGIMGEKRRKILLSSGARTSKVLLRAATRDAPDIFYMAAG